MCVLSIKVPIRKKSGNLLSALSRADMMMKEKQKSLKIYNKAVNIFAAIFSPENDEIRKLHDIHYFGVEKTLFLARKMNLHITRNAVKCMVKR